jgi:hypothetical protein
LGSLSQRSVRRDEQVAKHNKAAITQRRVEHTEVVVSKRADLLGSIRGTSFNHHQSSISTRTINSSQSTPRPQLRSVKHTRVRVEWVLGT